MDLSSDPMAVLEEWFSSEDDDAMTLITSTPDGIPSGRIVYCKKMDEQGIVFFTNYRSRKAREIAANPNVCCVFYYRDPFRQVIFEGVAERVSREETEAYFATRGRGSQLGAWASEYQSSPIPSHSVLESLQAVHAAQFPDEIPCPPYWGGFRVTPRRIELWQGMADRLHLRDEFVGRPGAWAHQTLSP